MFVDYRNHFKSNTGMTCCLKNILSLWLWGKVTTYAWPTVKPTTKPRWLICGDHAMFVRGNYFKYKCI